MPVPPPTPEFDRAIGGLGLELDATDRDRLAAFLSRLYEANERMNLTRVPPESAWMRHILDSLTLVPWIASLGAQREAARGTGDDLRIIDVGSGGGLPGIPLAIVLQAIVPQARLTLLEATGKKARFLAEAIEALGLAGARVVNERAETAAHDRPVHREQYDAVVSRAVGALPVLAELTLPLVRPGGFLMVIKGEKALEEVELARAAIGLLGGSFVESQTTPTGTLLRIEKMSRTPRTYPRLPGEPARRPLTGPRRRAAAPPPRERAP